MESDRFKELQNEHENWLKGYRSLTRYLANRDHSEKELKVKLSQKYEAELVSALITFAYESQWIPEPEQLAERTAQRLKAKGKGKIYIQKYLAEKGLPPVEFDPEEEIERARRLAVSKFGEWAELSYRDKQKIARFLLQRGFESSICWACLQGPRSDENVQL